MTVKIGIIGTGTISSAIVRGFCREGGNGYSITLSPRNAERAAALVAEFANVEVAASNQQVLDSSEWVIIAVIPRVGREVLSELTFRPDHKVINLMTDHTLEQVAALIGPTEVLVRMIPLPFIAHRVGPVVVYPANAPTAALFAPLGEVIEVDSERSLEAMSVTTALMSSFYELVSRVTAWGVDEGLAPRQSVQYSAAFFGALLGMARMRDPEGIHALANEMTPGGLNEMALKHIGAEDGFALWTDALTAVMDRIRKRNK